MTKTISLTDRTYRMLEDGRWRMDMPGVTMDEPMLEEWVISDLRKRGRNDLINQVNPMANFDRVYGD